MEIRFLHYVAIIVTNSHMTVTNINFFCDEKFRLSFRRLNDAQTGVKLNVAAPTGLCKRLFNAFEHQKPVLVPVQRKYYHQLCRAIGGNHVAAAQTAAHTAAQNCHDILYGHRIRNLIIPVGKGK